MGHINMTRVLLGGLLAGVVINVSEFVLNSVVLGADMQAALARLSLPMPSPNAIAVFLVMGFVLGIVTVWLYAAMRPRLEPGANAAACAGALVWFLAYCWGSIGFVVLGIFPLRMIVIGMVWGLFELVLAAVAGAWLYREAPAGRMTSPPMPA